jgi:hypothetical protein
MSSSDQIVRERAIREAETRQCRGEGTSSGARGGGWRAGG